LKKLAARYDLHVEILSKFESENDIEEAKKYLEIVSQDVFWPCIPILIKDNISEKFIKEMVDCPKESKLIIQIGTKLEKVDKLDIISNVLLSKNDCCKKDSNIISLKLKLLSESSGEQFLQSVKELEDVGK
jgi:hypothetical protein